MTPSKRNRIFDIVLFGATGFTGELVAEYLATDRELRIALAGRNLAKLKAVQNRVNRPDWELMQVDAKDRKTLGEVAANTAVICTTVGPYDKYGHDVVDACVQERTHYCDLTGETQFIRKMIDKHHERARANDTRIVHCCGFDSIPSDLGTWFLQTKAQEKFGSPCHSVTLYVTRIRGGFSGGTIASMTHVTQQAGRDRALRKLLLDPYALNPADNRPAVESPDQRGVVHADAINQWTAPFIMAAINTRVVRRSNALLDNAWGDRFRYHEAYATGSGPRGFARATAITTGSTGLIVALAVAPVRKLLQRTVLPDPGEGPSRDEIESGHFTLELVGKHEEGEIRAQVRGFRDPGYGATATMFAESARCLAIDPLETPGGVVTPATAMNEYLLARLRNAGMEFELID